MLHPTAAAIAKSLTGYESVAGTKEGEEQYQPEVTYDPSKFVKDDESTHPQNGSVKCDSSGVYWLYWCPSGEAPGCCAIDEEGKSYAYLYEGWYEVPSVEDVEDYCLSETAITPCGENEVEPDHPDGWPCLLGLM